MSALLIVAIALAAIVAIFAIQNSGVIMVAFLGWEWEASLALVLILTLGVGILVGYAAGLPSRWKKGSQLRQTKRQLENAEQAMIEANEPEEAANRTAD